MSDVCKIDDVLYTGWPKMLHKFKSSYLCYYSADYLPASPVCNRVIRATRVAFLAQLFLTFINVTRLTTSNCNSNSTLLHTLER